MTTTSADVLRLIEDGGKSQAIADLTGLPRGEIVRMDAYREAVAS